MVNCARYSRILEPDDGKVDGSYTHSLEVASNDVSTPTPVVIHPYGGQDDGDGRWAGISRGLKL